MVVRMGTEQIPFPRFEPAELADLFAFLERDLATTVSTKEGSR